MNNSKSLLALLLAFAAAGVGAQTTGATPGQATTGETYRPVLDASTTAAPAPAIDMRPMTQEEKNTGRQEPSRLKEIDPATHPAPQNVRPVMTPQTVTPTTTRQQIDASSRLPTPSAPRATPAPGPSSSQVNACVGATCTDASGATVTPGVGNSTVNSNGRLCNRTGSTVQCF